MGEPQLLLPAHHHAFDDARRLVVGVDPRTLNVLHPQFFTDFADALIEVADRERV